MGTNTVPPLLFGCCVPLPHWISSPPPSLPLWLWLTAPGMRASPSFRWHQTASNSNSIKASSHGGLLRGLQPRAATSSWGGASAGGTEVTDRGEKNKVTEEIMKWQQQQVKGGHWLDIFWELISHAERVQNATATIMFCQIKYLCLNHFSLVDLLCLTGFLSVQSKHKIYVVHIVAVHTLQVVSTSFFKPQGWNNIHLWIHLAGNLDVLFLLKTFSKCSF